MKIALCTIALRDKLLDVAFDTAEELGFDAVEVWGREPHIGERFDKNRVRATLKMAEKRGLSVPVFGSYYCPALTGAWGDPTITLTNTLHIARCLHAGIVRIWASDVASEKANPALWDKTSKEIHEACHRAADLDIALAAEMHSNTLCDTGHSAHRLLEMVAQDNFGINFQLSEHKTREPVSKRLAAVLPRVVHVHAQNYVALIKGDEKVRRAPLASGVYDYGELLGSLKAAGYEGYIGVEFAAEEGEGKTESLAADLRYLRSLLQAVP